MNKKKNYIWIIILLIISIIMLTFGLFLNFQNNNKLKPKNESAEKETPQEEKKENAIEPYINDLPNIRNEYNNPYIMGRLEIPTLGINSLVTRYTNNDYYLHYSIYNEKDDIGVPFFDYRNEDLSNNYQINIYGHNTTNQNIMDQLPFIHLESYTDENVFNNSKEILLYTDKELIKYKVIAVKIIDGSNNEHMKLVFKDETDFLDHTSKLLDDTLYKDSDIKLDKKLKLLVMQVCHYNPPDTYLLIIGKRIN